jgi:hypothetical protein
MRCAFPPHGAATTSPREALRDPARRLATPPEESGTPGRVPPPRPYGGNNPNRCRASSSGNRIQGQKSHWCVMSTLQRAPRWIAHSSLRGSNRSSIAGANRLENGPPVGYPLQYRVFGCDPVQVKAIVDKVDVDQDKVRELGISSHELQIALQASLSGNSITDFREGDQDIAVVSRRVGAERSDLNNLKDAKPSVRAGRSCRCPSSRDSEAARARAVYAADSTTTLAFQCPFTAYIRVSARLIISSGAR